MSLKDRISSFLSNISGQSTPVRVQAYSADGKSNQAAGQAFVNALKVAIPSLLLVASAHAQSATPEVTLTHNDRAIPLATAQTASQVLIQSLVTAAFDDRAQQLVECFEEKVNIPELDTVDTTFAALLVRAQAGHDLNEMDAYANKKGLDPNLVIAAYCTNPLDWQTTIKDWEQRAERATAMARAATAQAYLEQKTTQSFATYAAQSATLHNAMQYAARYQSSQGQFDRSLMHKTSGNNDWISAALSIASGVAEVTGSRDSKNAVRDARRTANSGQRISNRVKNLNRYKGARKWEQVGNIVGDVGRTVDLGEVLGRMRPR